MDLLRLVLRVALGGLFVYASLTKIASPGSFAHEIHNYRLVPVFLVNPMAIVLPWLELFCGLALIGRRFSPGADALVFLMMAVFTGAVASAVVRGLNISCGCFKTGGSSVGWGTVARDVAIVAVAALNACWAWRGPWNSRT